MGVNQISSELVDNGRRFPSKGPTEFISNPKNNRKERLRPADSKSVLRIPEFLNLRI